MSQVSILSASGGGTIITLTGNAGGAVSPDGAGNFNLVGGSYIVATGNPATNTITFELASSIVVDDISTSNAAHHLYITNNSISVLGTDVNADINVTPKGTGDLVLSNGGIDCTGLVTNSDIRSINGYISGYNVSTITNPAIAVTLNENGIYADGTDANVDVAIIAKGTGAVSIDGLWGSTLQSQWKTVQRSTTTADATPKIIFTIPLVEKQMVTVKAYINGFKDTYDIALTGEVGIAVFRAVGGNVAIVGDKVVNYSASGASSASVDATATVGTQSLDVTVTGVVAENWQWVTTVSYMYTLLP